MKLIAPIALTFFIIAQNRPSAAATCLDDVANFAIRICGDIANSGTSTVVDANGNIDASISNIIKMVVGGASTSINGHILYDTYVGVARDQLAGVHFSDIDCRQKMVNIAVAQVCQIVPPPPPPPQRDYKICMGNGGGPSCAGGATAVYNCATYRGMGGGAKVTYDTLANMFCSYDDNGTTKVWPHKVIVTYDVGGGECGWTAFQVTCNPH
jgi:hypothetical protein